MQQFCPKPSTKQIKPPKQLLLNVHMPALRPNNHTGNKQKNFQPRACRTRSCFVTASNLTSLPRRTACRNLPRTNWGQLSNTANLLSNTLCKLMRSSASQQLSRKSSLMTGAIARVVGGTMGSCLCSHSATVTTSRCSKSAPGLSH